MANMRPPTLTALALLGLCLMSVTSARMIKTGRTLSQTVGEVTTVSPKLPQVQHAARFVVAQITADPSLLPGLEGTALLVAVTNATEQTVSGTKYGLWITITNSANTATFWFTKAYVVDAPWNSPAMTLESLKVLGAAAGEDDSLIFLGAGSGDSSSTDCAGCVQPLNPNAVNVRAVADFLVAQVNTDPALFLLSTSGQVSLAVISRATQQLVAGGMRYRVWLTLEDEAAVEYHVQAYVLSTPEQQPANSLQWFALNTLGATASPATANPFAAGEVTPADPSSPAVVQAAAFSVQQINANAALIPTLTAPATLAKIAAATEQVVEGVQYGLDLLVKDAAGRTFRVQDTVLSVPWLLPPMSLVSFEVITYPPLLTAGNTATGTSAGSDTPVVGAWTKADPKSPEVQAAASFVVAQINLYPSALMPSAGAPVEAVAVVAALSKVVTGTEYAITMIVQDSHSAVFAVEAIVLDIPWLLPGMTLQKLAYRPLVL